MPKIFKSEKTTSFSATFWKYFYSLSPCIWCTGVKVEFISSDFQEIHVSLKRNIRTYNKVGTVFGGSIYSSIDPFLMLMLMKNLGEQYVVWDKHATVQFIRPIVKKVKCRFEISEDRLSEIKQTIELKGSGDFVFQIHYEDDLQSKVYAAFTKTIYVSSREHYLKSKAGAKPI